MTERTAVRSYQTDFSRDEDPISEDGLWLNGKADGIDWADVVSKNGRCYGGPSRNEVLEARAEQGTMDATGTDAVGDYDDPTAVIGGEWGPNQHGKGVVFSENPTDEYYQEVQIRLRTEIKANWCRGYEVFFRCLKSDQAYAEIVRWNGKIGDWTSLERHEGIEYGVEDGDVIEATIEGNVLKGFINGKEVISVTDDTEGAVANGCPGVGFNFGCGDTGPEHGFTSLEVETYE